MNDEKQTFLGSQIYESENRRECIESSLDIVGKEYEYKIMQQTRLASNVTTA